VCRRGEPGLRDGIACYDAGQSQIEIILRLQDVGDPAEHLGLMLFQPPQPGERMIGIEGCPFGMACRAAI
jgi:hypothetical protein